MYLSHILIALFVYTREENISTYPCFAEVTWHTYLKRTIFIEIERAEQLLILIYHYVIGIKLLLILIFIL